MQPQIGEFYVYQQRTYKVLAISPEYVTVIQYPHGFRKHQIPTARWEDFTDSGELVQNHRLK